MTHFVNRTRVSTSIPRRLVREGKFHLLPLYAVLRTSDLAREGMEHSGSYLFADHVYRSRPSGRFPGGRFVDRVLLRMRAVRSMRSRYAHSRDRIVEELAALGSHGDRTVLSVPCGIARELVEAACALRERAEPVYRRTTFNAMDLDPAPLEHTRRLAREHGIHRIVDLRADAFDATAYPDALDVIVSTGFGEFLDDAQLVRFYEICRLALRPGALFVTSGMSGRPLVDYLLRELAEIRVHYRAPDRLFELATRAGFHAIDVRTDSVGFQHLMTARS